ncbi:MAG: 2-oxo-4-hydroxy-4-carboxy-5-ureidoimidazoline decarboxylase [Pseudomonadota bacterium]
MNNPVDLATLNAVSVDRFVEILGHVAEDSPDVARMAADRRPFADLDDLTAAFERALGGADGGLQLAVLRAHPDLAGKLSMADASRREQRGAGLDSLTGDELRQFESLNAAYRERFGFPFIFAVRGATKHQILRAFETRLDRDVDVERQEALSQVAKIMRWRLLDAVSS